MHAPIHVPIFAPWDAKVRSPSRRQLGAAPGPLPSVGASRDKRCKAAHPWPNERRGLPTCLDSFSKRSLYRRLVWPGPVHDAQQGGGVAQLVRAAES